MKLEYMHDFDELIDRRGTDSKKYSEAVYAENVIPMWIADSDFKAPEPVINALVERMRQGVYGYTIVSQRLRVAAAKWQKERFCWTIDENSVEFVPGVVSGIISAVRALSHPGDNIVIQSPCYPPFADSTENNGRHLLRNEMILVQGHYEIDFGDLEVKLKEPRTKIFILCNPQNPTGRVFSKEELVRMGELCIKYNVIVLADEIHGDIIYYGHKHIPIASISPAFAQNTITFINPSKTFNLPGFRTAAFIAANSELKRSVHEMVVNNKAIGENICGTLAFYTAYEKCAYYADQLSEYLYENKKLVEKTLEHVNGICCVDAEGTYLLWLDCRGLGMKQKELDLFFSQKARVGLNSGKSFGSDGEGFVRMNIACPKCMVVEALDRIVDALGNLN